MKQETKTSETQSPPQLHFRLEPDPARLARARERIRDYLSLYCRDERAVKETVLCLDEAFTNTIRHSGSPGDIDIRVRLEPGKVRAVVRDHGRGFDVSTFDPASLPDLDRDSGRGLFLIASLTDELRLRSDHGLELQMIKSCPVCEAQESFESGFDMNAARNGRLARTRAMLEEIEEAFIAIDWDYRVLYANSVARRLAQELADEIVGMSLEELFPDFQRSAIGIAIREAMELGRAGTAEYQGLAGWSEGRVYPPRPASACSSGTSMRASAWKRSASRSSRRCTAPQRRPSTSPT